jgi:predicted ATPase
MSKVAQWLETLGMAEYAERFVENRIDLSVLRDLTDQDLKDLGVVLGDRRKLLRAIRERDAATSAAPAGDAEASSADRQSAVAGAREIGHAATLMFALSHVSLTLLHAGRRDEAAPLIGELVDLADGKGTLYWKSYGLLLRGWLVMLQGEPARAVEIIRSAMVDMRSTGATGYAPWYLSVLARAHAELGQFADARRCISEALSAMEATGERWCEADVQRRAGEIERLVGRPA